MELVDVADVALEAPDEADAPLWLTPSCDKALLIAWRKLFPPPEDAGGADVDCV